MICIIPIGRRRKRSSQFRIRFSCTMNSTMFSLMCQHIQTQHQGYFVIRRSNSIHHLTAQSIKLMSRRSTNCYRFFNLITRTFFKWVYIRFYIHNLNRLISRCKDTFFSLKYKDY